MCAVPSPADPDQAATGLTRNRSDECAGVTSHGPCLRVRLLGGFALAWGERALPPIASVVARSVFAYLITHRDLPHTRDLLGGTFWPDLPDIQAHRRLSQALWQIGCLLRPLPSPAPYLLADAEGVQFNAAAPYWLDVEEFERLVAHTALRDAVALYRGDFLAGFYDDWMVVERERLRDLYLATLARLLLLSKREGDYEVALGYAHRLVAEDPLSEEGHREAIRLCYLLGRPLEARQQYERCRAILAAELGVEPSAATTALYREIAAGDATAEMPYLPPVALARPAPLLEGGGQVPLVGRATERATLLGWLEEAGRGHGGLALIEGESGVGKTRLLQEVARDAGWRGVEVLWGCGRTGEALPAQPAGGSPAPASGTTCAAADAPGNVSPLPLAPPYGPLIEALRAGLSPLRVGQLRELVEPAWLSEASLLLPELIGEQADLAPTTRPDADRAAEEQDRARLLEALARVVLALGQLSPHLLILDDLQWADVDTFSALARLAEHLATGRVLLIGACRSDEARARPVVWEALQALDRVGGGRRLMLAPLTLEETAELVRCALGLTKSAPYFAARLHRETAGNPLFVLETLRGLHDERVLYRDQAGEWSTPWDGTTVDYAELPLPVGVRQVIARRLAQLGPGERAALHAAAVLGAEFDLPLLLCVSSQARSACVAAAGELVRRGLLEEMPAAYRFSHDQVRRAAYAAIPEGERRRLHRRAGEALQERKPPSAADLAYHYGQAQERDKAVGYGIRAGDQARALYAYVGALTHYDQALALTEEDDLATRWELQRRREETLDVLGRREEQAASLAQMQRLAVILGDEQRRALALYRQGHFEVNTGAPSQGLTRLQEAARLAQEQGNLSLAGECQAMIGRAHWHLGDAARCLAAAEDARVLFRKADNRAGEVHALSLMGNFYLGILGHHERALRCFEQVLAIGREMRHEEWENRARLNAGIALMSLGCHRQSQAHLAAASTFFTRTGNKPLLGAIAFAQGRNALGLGDYEGAQQFGEQGLALCRETGDLNFALENLAVLGLAALHRGQHPQARRYFTEAVATAQAGEQAADLPWLQSYLALAHLHLGEEAQARALSDASVAEWEAPGADVSFPEIICFHRYQILARLEGAATARPYLAHAYRVLMERAGTIEDPTLRRSFLENVRENRGIVEAHRAWQAGDRTVRVRLPRAEAPTGRPLRDDEWVEVTWTVATGGDGTMGDKTRRRQHRLLRLLREAQAQGAAPTVDDLAAALEVSRATVKRDLAELRGMGQAARTRGAAQDSTQMTRIHADPRRSTLIHLRRSTSSAFSAQSTQMTRIHADPRRSTLIHLRRSTSSPFSAQSTRTTRMHADAR